MCSKSFALYVLSILSSTLLVSAAVLPIVGENEYGTFSITEIPNTAYIKSSLAGPAAMRYAYFKHDIKMPSSLAGIKHAAKHVGEETGSVSARPYPTAYDREYLVNVSLGTPAQVLPVDLDTGSSDFWVFSTDTAPAQVREQALYQPNASSTAKFLPGETWSITYADGSGSSGIVYSDVVTIGGLSFPTQAVESAQFVSRSFTSESACSGLLGLAFSNLNRVRPTQQLTFIDNIRPNLRLPLFTANLKKGAVGTYDFGFINPASYIGSITYAPVSSPRGLWLFTSSGYQFGNGSFVGRSFPAIADTGTSLLLLPPSIVKAYYAKIPGAMYASQFAAWTFPCAAELPAFVFGVAAYRGVVPGPYLNYGQISATICYGGLQSQENAPFAIFGDVLLKAQFVVFDLGGRRVGFANKLSGRSASG